MMSDEYSAFPGTQEGPMSDREVLTFVHESLGEIHELLQHLKESGETSESARQSLSEVWLEYTKMLDLVQGHLNNGHTLPSRP